MDSISFQAPSGLSSFLLWDELNDKTCLIWVQNRPLNTQGWRKVQSTYQSPAIASASPSTLSSEHAWYKGQRGVGEAPPWPAPRAAFHLPPLSCEWDPEGWCDLFYGIPGALGW